MKMENTLYSKEEGVIKVDVDMCALGLKTEDKGKVGYAKKATTIMTNSQYVAWRVHRKCNKMHEHIHLLNSKASPAQQFTKQFCRAITKGMVEQREQWVTGVYTILRIDPDYSVSAASPQGGVVDTDVAVLSLSGKYKGEHDATVEPLNSAVEHPAPPEE